MKGSGSSGTVKITVVFDNYLAREGLKTGWGFGCVVDGLSKRVLFDTGADAETLLANMEALGVDARSIDAVFLSHIHGDHTGGLEAFLQKNAHVEVYLPASFPSSFIKKVASTGAKVVKVDKGANLFDEVYSTGQMGLWIKEQAMVIRQGSCAAVITGCAHPGVVQMVSEGKRLCQASKVFVMGGFHLFSAGRSQLKKVVSELKELGVKWAGPCHCSGDVAREVFKEEFGSGYIQVGVGATVDVSALFSSDSKADLSAGNAGPAD